LPDAGPVLDHDLLAEISLMRPPMMRARTSVRPPARTDDQMNRARRIGRLRSRLRDTGQQCRGDDTAVKICDR
jgi:hypothetical protein